MERFIYQIKDLECRYREAVALSIESLRIKTGSIVGLMGPNGSGKSTLLKALAFLIKPVRGEILFCGRPGAPFSDAVRFRVTLLTQEPYLMKRSVFENISYGLKIRRDNERVTERVFESLSAVGLSPEDFAGRKWSELSGGEAQRVALAARLVLKPDVLLLDEPTASVDAASAHLIREASVGARKDWGATLVIASHDWHWLYEICDEVKHLYKGRLMENGLGSIVFGPWAPVSSREWRKRLNDGQLFYVPKPERGKSTALVDSKSLYLDTEKSGRHRHSLRGVISRLILEKQTGMIVATVIAGSLSFTMTITRERVSDLGLYPGREVYINYNPEAVSWQ